MLVNVFDDAAVAVLVFALAAGPGHLLLFTELLRFILSVVRRHAFFHVTQSLRRVWLESQFLVIRDAGFESFFIDEASHDCVQGFFTGTRVFLSRLLAQSFAQLGIVFLLLPHLSRDFAAQELWCHILLRRLIK